MAVLPELKKVLASGKRVSLVAMQRADHVMQTVGSYLKAEGGKQLVHLKDPSNKKLGTLEYHVVLPFGRFVFKKLPQARALRKAFKPVHIDSVIIRIDTTDEGFIVSEREIK